MIYIKNINNRRVLSKLINVPFRAINYPVFLDRFLMKMALIFIKRQRRFHKTSQVYLGDKGKKFSNKTREILYKEQYNNDLENFHVCINVLYLFA
jgi:hypothetical protein